MAAINYGRVFPIYNEDGSSFHDLVIYKATMDSVVMSLGDKITGEVYYKDNTLDVTMKEYIEFKRNVSDENEEVVKYVLVNPPTIVREGMVSDNSDLKGMTKYSFEFYHPMYVLSNIPFTDVAVSSDEEKYLSQNKTFSWIGRIKDFAAKINKNLQGTEWVVIVNEETIQDKLSVLSDVLTFDNNYISDALKTAYETWQVPYVVDSLEEGQYYYTNSQNEQVDYYSQEGGGKRFVILFGLPSNEIYQVNNNGDFILDENNEKIPFIFKFGQGLGLKNNSRNPRNNKIITRIAGYGSTDNIPFGYPQIVWTGDSRWEYTKYVNDDPQIDDDGKPHGTPAVDAYPLYKGIVGGAYVKLIKHPFTRDHLMPSIYAQTVNLKVNPLAQGYNPNIEIVDYYDATQGSYPNPINLEAPSFEIHAFEGVKPELGVEKIVSAVPINNDLTEAEEWDDSMDENGSYNQSYFKVTLPILSFDLYACAAITQEMSINMRSGACIGCTFQVQVDWEDYKRNFYNSEGEFDPTIKTAPLDEHVRDGEKYPDSSQQQITIILQKDTSTFSTLMPNRYQQPKGSSQVGVDNADTFVVLGISLPLSYITNAEGRLDADMREYMLENNVYYYDYPLKFSEHFLATHLPILSQIRNNTIVRFEFGDGERLALYVKQITIKYGDSVLPQYDITLTDDVEIVLNQIGQVAEDVSRLRLNVDQLQYYYNKGFYSEINAIKRELLRHEDTFLNKHGDTATGLITFLQGIISNSVKSSDFTGGDLDGRGFGVWVDENGKSHAEFDVLSARMKAIFTELEIKKLRYSGGNLIFSAAGGEIIRVENFSSYWRCYFKADDGEDGAVNLWDTDDLAMCRTFNLTSSGSTTLGNRYYWRRVVNAATRVVDGETLAYIDLSKSIYDTSVANDEPAVGDMVVQVGNRDNTKADRQNVILLEVVGTNAPSFKGYTNINTFSLSNDKLVFQWSPNACQVRSDRFRLLTSSNGSVSENPIVNDRGAWVSGATYAYYDRVSYNGNLWLCTNQSGTSGMPSVSSDWLLQVSKGEDGKAFNIKDKVNSVSDLPATGEEGDAYMVGDHLYVWSTIYNTYWNGWGQQDAPFSGFVSSTPMTLTAGQKYKVVIDAVTTQSEFVDVVPVRSSFGNALYLAKGAEMTSGGAQATETEAFLLYPSGNEVNVYYQNTGLGNYASITIDVYEQSVGWRDMGTLRGVDGVDAYNIQLSTDNIVFDTDVNGQAILSGNNEVSVALYKGGEAVANPTIGIGTTTGCTASASGSVVTINAVSASSGQVVINVSKGSDFSGSKILKFACITYQTMKSFAQEIVDDSMTNYATSERVGTLEGNVTTLSSSVSSLQQTSTNLTSRVSNNEGNISSLDQRASSLETSVKSGLVNLFSDGERERSSNQGTLSIDVSPIVRRMIGYAKATYSADVMLLDGASATISLSLVVNGANKGTTTYVVQNDGAWHRISVSYAITASDVQTISSAIVNVLFAQVLEQGEVPLSYHVRHIQAQLGGIATEWQPSQADYETKFVQTPTQAGILAYTQGQEVASIGVYSDGKVKLTGEEIQLEGNITANGNVRIDENGMIHAKGGVFDGYIRSSVAKDLWYETESYGFYYHPVKSQLNLMFTYDGKVLLPSDPEYIGARVLIVGGLTNSGADAKIDICPARSYSVRCYEFYPEGTGSDSVTWASSDNTVMSVKAPWAQATNWQIYDPVACRTILGLDMSGGSYIRMENGTIELLGVPCYKRTSDPIYKLKEDNNGTIEGRKLREDGTLDTTTTQMYSRDGEVTEWTQWVIINRSVKKLTIMQ